MILAGSISDGSLRVGGTAMEAGQHAEQTGNLESGPHFVDEPGPEDLRAWEQIESGRYMPRRIRGSYRGRALG
jgi:hypothetical protein